MYVIRWFELSASSLGVALGYFDISREQEDPCVPGRKLEARGTWTCREQCNLG